jgi:hypothetical protein
MCLLHAGVQLIGKVPCFGVLTSLIVPFLELELFHGYNPNKKVLNQEAKLIHGFFFFFFLNQHFIMRPYIIHVSRTYGKAYK